MCEKDYFRLEMINFNALKNFYEIQASCPRYTALSLPPLQVHKLNYEHPTTIDILRIQTGNQSEQRRQS